MATWHTIFTAREGWEGAPLDDAVLLELLDTARAEVTAYAPALDDPQTIPLRDNPEDSTSIPDGWRVAQLQHARNIWNSVHVNPAGAYGAGDGEGFALTPFPLDWTIKQRLRPRQPLGGTVA